MKPGSQDGVSHECGLSTPRCLGQVNGLHRSRGRELTGDRTAQLSAHIDKFNCYLSDGRGGHRGEYKKYTTEFSTVSCALHPKHPSHDSSIERSSAARRSRNSFLQPYCHSWRLIGDPHRGVRYSMKRCCGSVCVWVARTCGFVPGLPQVHRQEW